MRLTKDDLRAIADLILTLNEANCSQGYWEHAGLLGLGNYVSRECLIEEVLKRIDKSEILPIEKCSYCGNDYRGTKEIGLCTSCY